MLQGVFPKNIFTLLLSNTYIPPMLIFICMSMLCMCTYAYVTHTHIYVYLYMHRLNGHGFGGTPGVGDGQGGLACCGSWGHKESDVSEQLKWTELNQGIPNLSEKCLWILLGTVIDSPSKTSAENISGKEQGKLCNLQTSISLSFTLFSRDKEGELAFW